MNPKVVARNLENLRQSKNWTQEEIAEKLNISRQAISKWETGASLPNLESLLCLSKIYNISINEIIEPTDSKNINDFEDIIYLDFKKLKSILSNFDISEIVKASMGASPQINELLKELFSDIDFSKERIAIGSIRITEIDNIQREIVDEINTKLIS